MPRVWLIGLKKSMKKILIINGPNLNLLGVREPELYGKKTYADLVKFIKQSAKELGVKVVIFQSNEEGKIVTAIQNALKGFDGIIINAAAYTHTSIAILDALKAVGIKTVEVHLTDVNSREEYRKKSFIKEYAFLTISGEGFMGYKRALEEIIK